MRSEEDKVCQSPLEVILGGETYEVKPLVIAEARKWRKEVAKLIGSLPRYANVTTDAPDAFADAIGGLLVAMPDAVGDLFFGYARDLDREAIEQVATEAELAKAFEQVMEIAFPLARALGTAMGKMAQ
jgi:hypothetical protein